MPEQGMRSILHEIAAEGLIEPVDLWPAVAARIQAIKQKQDRPAFRRNLQVAALTAVLMMGSFLIFHPAILAQVGGWLPHFGQQQRAGLVLVNPTSVGGVGQLPTSSAPGVATSQSGSIRLGPAQGVTAPQSATVLTANLTLAEAQQQVPYHIRVPSWLPPDIVFRGGLVGPDEGVVVSYRRGDEPTKGIGIQMRPGQSTGGYAFPVSAAEATQVDGQAATYVHGTWRQGGEWDGTADAGALSWQQGGFTYVLSFSGLGLSRDDLVRIAESMR